MLICIKSYYIYFFPTAATNGAKAKEIKKKNFKVVSTQSEMTKKLMQKKQEMRLWSIHKVFMYEPIYVNSKEK